MQVVQVRFHHAELDGCFTGAIPSFERAPTAILTIRVSIPPCFETLPKGAGRHDVFPFEPFGAGCVTDNLVATAAQIDLFALVLTAAIEGQPAIRKDWRDQLLGVFK